MEKALKDKKRAIITFVIFLFIALAFTVISVWCCVKERMYVIMLLFAICASICYYCSVFALFRYFDARAAVDMIDIMGITGYSGRMITISELADSMGWSIKSTRRFMERCAKKGYLR